MKKGNKTDEVLLRQKAEELLKKKSSVTFSPFSEVESLRLIHELEVHQIELELQNKELRHARTAAEVANDKYVRLYDYAPSGYFTLSSTGKIIELNLTGARLLGKERQHLKNSQFTIFVSKETKPIFIRFLEKVFKNKTKETCEIKLVTNGEFAAYVLLTGTVTEHLDQCNVTAVDITESRIAQEALKLSEKRYRTTIESITDAFFTLDNELRFTYFNKQAEELLMQKSSDVLGKKIFSDVFKEAKGSVFEEKYTYALTAREICTFETFFGIEPDINWYDVRVYPGTGGISVFFTVITEKKKADSALRLSLSKYQTLFNLFPSGITISDSHGQIIETNSIAQHLFGLAPEQQMQRQIDGKEWQIIRPDGSPMPASEYPSVRALDEKCQIENVEMGIRKGDDQITWINVSATPIPLEGYGVAIVYNDITPLKNSQQELLKAKDKAEESDRLKSAFLANMSHEIRTPMNGILGFIDLLKNPDLTNEQNQEYIRIVEKSGARMLNIINDIIDISKIEAGLTNLEIKESDINEQIDYIYTFFKPEVEARGIKFSVSKTLPAKEAIIKTDREKLFAILTNLIKNAIKYTENGSIEFGYGLKTGIEPAELEFYIKDTGIGIPKDRQEAIFERFIQADIADKMAQQGAGLGLTITKSYVEMLGGKIGVKSEEGIGSTFYFTLPYNGVSAIETIDQQLVPSGKTDTIRQLKILIAEDDEVSGMLIDITIKSFCKEILKVRTGIDAVKACRENRDIDLILMDIQMPEMNGYEATKQIRKFNKEVVIIAQTAYGLTGDREKSIKAGCDDYIAKPTNKEKLLSLIQKYFGDIIQ